MWRILWDFNAEIDKEEIFERNWEWNFHENSNDKRVEKE
jgi:hypothetical protein